MGNYRILYAVILACILCGYTQVSLAADDRPAVGVTQFTCDEESPYTGLVTEKVVEMLTNTHRFVVVDRTSREKVDDYRRARLFSTAIILQNKVRLLLPSSW